MLSLCFGCTNVLKLSDVEDLSVSKVRERVVVSRRSSRSSC